MIHMIHIQIISIVPSITFRVTFFQIRANQVSYTAFNWYSHYSFFLPFDFDYLREHAHYLIKFRYA